MCAKGRLYTFPKKGGLGLMPIKQFLIAQHTLWFKRCCTSTKDNWRVDLTVAVYGNPLATNPAEICRNSHLVLHQLSLSFAIFNELFYKSDGNFKWALILNNPIFRRNRVDFRLLDAKKFSGANIYRIAFLRFCDSFTDRSFTTFSSLLTLNTNFNLKLTGTIYFKLRACGVPLWAPTQLWAPTPQQGPKVTIDMMVTGRVS